VRRLLLVYYFNFAHICICYGISINLCDKFDSMNIFCGDIPTCYKFTFVLEFLIASLKLASYFCTKTGYIFKHRALFSTLCTTYIAFFSCVLRDFRVTPCRCNTFEQHGNSLLKLSVCNRKQYRNIVGYRLCSMT
jgi:hypothetical protein